MPKKHIYFISFAYVEGGMIFNGNAELGFDSKITRMADIKLIEEHIEKNTSMGGRTVSFVRVLHFQLLRIE